MTGLLASLLPWPWPHVLLLVTAAVGATLSTRLWARAATARTASAAVLCFAVAALTAWRLWTGS